MPLFTDPVYNCVGDPEAPESYDYPSWQGSFPSDAELAAFRDDFLTSVHEAWNNKLSLVPTTPGGSGVRELPCAVEIEFTEDPSVVPHLRIQLLFRPRAIGRYAQQYPRFRASCWNGGAQTHYVDSSPRGRPEAYDMYLAWSGRRQNGRSGFLFSENRDTSDNGEVRISQNVAAHEFGHYLGLQHTCARPVRSDGGLCNMGEYCANREEALQRDIMAAGSDIDAWHGWPFVDRLWRHHTHCDRSWVGQVR